MMRLRMDLYGAMNTDWLDRSKVATVNAWLAAWAGYRSSIGDHDDRGWALL